MWKYRLSPTEGKAIGAWFVTTFGGTSGKGGTGKTLGNGIHGSSSSSGKVGADLVVNMLPVALSGKVMVPVELDRLNTAKAYLPGVIDTVPLLAPSSTSSPRGDYASMHWPPLHDWSSVHVKASSETVPDSLHCITSDGTLPQKVVPASHVIG